MTKTNTKCVVCEAALSGNQLMYCSSRCKQKAKNDGRRDELNFLRRKVKRLEREVKKLRGVTA